MTFATRRKLVVLIFIACVGLLWLILPRDAEAQNRRRDREKKIAADAAASPPAPIPKANRIDDSTAAPDAPATAPTSSSPPPPQPPAAPPRSDPPKSNRPTKSNSPSGPIVPPSNATRTAYSDHFSLLTQKNIFLRNRPSMTRSATNSRPSSYSQSSGPSRPVEESLVLTGIILEVDRPIAFIENQSSGTTQRLTIGDPIAHGTISDMGLDFLEYETNDGQLTRIDIGRTFTGEAPPAPAVTATPAPATTSPTSAPSTAVAGTIPDSGDDAGGPRPAGAAPPAPGGGVDPGKANLSIEEKMKLKRLQELKK